jgi:protein-disulfide isomerase
MSKKNREGGLSKRQEMREKRRRDEQRNRWVWIGLIIVGALLIVFFFVYPQLKPVANITAATPRPRPQVNGMSSGDPNAKVKMTEFSDFQCPYCKQFWTDTESQVFDTYVNTGKVLFVYRSAGNFVSDNVNRSTGGTDTESQAAAAAAYCASDQNKFWEMHDALFANAIGEADGTSFTDRRLQAIAKSVGLDMSTFNSCYSSNKYQSQVAQDFTDAVAAGLQGTPFFVITYTANGQTQTVKLDGAQPFSVFQQELDKALAAADK